jgi:hypothetical protein
MLVWPDRCVNSRASSSGARLPAQYEALAELLGSVKKLILIEYRQLAGDETAWTVI